MRNLMLGVIVISSLLPTISFADETTDPSIKEAQDRYNKALQEARQEEVAMQQQAANVQANAIAFALLPKAAGTPLASAPTTQPATTQPSGNTANNQTTPATNSNNWTQPNPWANQTNPWKPPASASPQPSTPPAHNQQNTAAPATNNNIYLPPSK